MKGSGAELLVAALERQRASRAFLVPGESYLPVLDALRDGPIHMVVCRQEGGAAMMAEADGKLTGRPGLCFVTRGPGATNAASGIHVASHDGTPMILFVGQVPRAFRGRGAFQELDYDKLFGGMAKAVFEARSPDELPDLVARAYVKAMDGLPGPVVVALPEDTLSGQGEVPLPEFVEPAIRAPSDAEMEELRRLLSEAERPFMILGGPRWTAEAVSDIQRFAEAHALAVACSFRRQQLFPYDHPNYAGDLGLGPNPELLRRIREADLVLAVGARLGEVPSQGYSLFDVPRPKQRLVHVLPDDALVGRLYQPHLGIVADPASFAASAASLPERSGEVARVSKAHATYLAWSQPARDRHQRPGFIDPFEVMEILERHLPKGAVMTNGAGNYAGWLHRYHRFAGYGTQLAPTSGSMGYGLPAAIAAKLRDPERAVICFAGDGCFLMTGQEFSTAVQAGANVVVLVFDNGQYGTIRMHQERRYPGRVAGTSISPTDFAALARGYGGVGLFVDRGSDLPSALDEALSCSRPALIHLRMDPDRISTTMRLGEQAVDGGASEGANVP